MMDTNSTASANAGLFLYETWRIIEESLRVSFVYALVVSGFSIAMDLSDPDGTGTYLLVNIVSLIAGYFLAIGMLRESGLLVGKSMHGFGSYFVVSLLTGIGLVVGVLLLIIPGVFLAVRWMPVFGFLFASDEGSTDAIGTAFAKTEGFFWPIFLGALVPFAVFAAAMYVYLMPDIHSSVSFELATIGGNVLLSVATVVGSAYGLATFSLLRDSSDELTEVFE